MLNFQQTIKLAKNLRRGNRKAIHSRLEPALRSRLHELDDFFEVKLLNTVYVKGKSRSLTPRPVVVCKSVSGLINYIKARRNLGQPRIKIGIDGGQGSLKITLNVEGGDGESAKFKDSGVRRTFVIALAPKVQENFENIREIWVNQLQLNEIEAIVASKTTVIEY